MAHSEGDEILMSGEATGGDDSDEEIEVTAAEVLVQLETVSFYLSSLNHVSLKLTVFFGIAADLGRKFSTPTMSINSATSTTLS